MIALAAEHKISAATTSRGLARHIDALRSALRRGARSAPDRTFARPATRSSARYKSRLARILAGEACPRGASRLLADSRTEKYRRRVEAAIMASWPYWRSASSWVGGEHSICVRLVDSDESVGGKITTNHVWHPKRPWSGTRSCGVVRVSRGIPADMIVCGGLVTVAAHRVRGHYRAAWLTQRACAANSPLRVVWGHIVRGYYHVAGTDLSAAIAEEREARRRQHAAGLAAARASRLRSEATRNRWLTIDDCRRAGFCGPGTEQAVARVAARLGIAVDDIHAGAAIRADAVIAALPGQTYHTDRVLAVAQH
jgi:hypothetical protein